MKALRTLTLSAATAVLVTACAGLMANADFDPATNFGAYQTYAWAPRDALPTGDPRLDANPFFDARVRSAVDTELAARGFTQSASGPGLLVHYHASVRERLDVYRVDREAGYSSGYGERDNVTVYEEGTLLVDLVDAASNRVIWRGWALSDIGGVIDNPERMEQRILESTRKMFEKFPARQ
ncbi:MAG TPA: DUF4136 domain-containing protein [Gemmatimonadales bacterium]